MLKNSYCCYQVNVRDTITSIGGAWSEFARKNEGDALLNQPPLGHSIWDFIEGNSTKYIYAILMKQVRDTGESIQFPFRGDSAAMVRYMGMKISLGEASSLWFETSISKEMPKEMDRALYGRPQQLIPLVHMCAWCNLVQVKNEWLSLEAAIWVLGLFDTSETPPITHGICPTCAQLLEQSVQRKKNSLQQHSWKIGNQISVAR